MEKQKVSDLIISEITKSGNEPVHVWDLVEILGGDVDTVKMWLSVLVQRGEILQVSKSCYTIS